MKAYVIMILFLHDDIYMNAYYVFCGVIGQSYKATL